MTPIADEPVRRPTTHNYELDVYTAIAVVASVIFTVYQFCNVGNQLYRGTAAHTVLASLDVAVPWFFVLIGYRTFRPIVVAYLDENPSVPTRTLLSRQAVALIPAYYVVVTVVWFCRQQTLPGDWHDLLEHLTFTQVFDSKRIFYTDGPAWAVSVTVFFLMLLAAVNAGLSRFGRVSTRRHRLLLLAMPIAALITVSIAWKAWSLAGAHRPTFGSSTTWYGPVANLDNFAMGMAAALALGAFTPARLLMVTKYRVPLRLGAAVVLVMAIVARHNDPWSTAYFTTACSVVFAGLIGAAAIAADGTTRLVTPRLRSAGRIVTIAYGTYLWHEPVLLALNGWGGAVDQSPHAFVQNTIVVLAASTMIGCLSYIAVEQPAHQLYQLASRSPRASTGDVVSSS